MAIDAGHTRTQPGATSARGQSEWQFNIQLAQRVERAFHQQGMKAVLLNPTGAPQTLVARTHAARAAGANLLISVHHDSVQPHYLSTWIWEGKSYAYSDAFQGFSLFVSARQPFYAQSQLLARRISDQLLASGLQPSLHHAEPIPGENRSLLDAQRGIYRFDGLVVLKTAAMPAVLIEAGVIVHREEEVRLRQVSYQDRMAQAVVKGSVAYCAATTLSAT